MGNKLYVGNLPFSATVESLTNLFAEFGKVDSCRIITDQESGRSKGFGFVEMSTSEEASDVIAKCDGKDFEGRQIKVNEATPQENRPNNRNNNRRW